MGFASRFNCKRNKKLDFSRYLVLDQIIGLEVIEGRSGIGMSEFTFLQKITKPLFGTQKYASLQGEG